MTSAFRQSSYMKCFLAVALFPIVVSLITILWPIAAALAAGSTVDASCSAMQNYGFTTGVVYCIEKSLDNAVTQYVTAMQSALRYYEGMMLAVAIAVFGYKLMNQDVQDPKKELIEFGIRVLLGVFVYENAINMYHWICGTIGNPAGSTGMISEAIFWVTGVGGSGSGAGSGSMFAALTSNCKVDNPPSTFAFGGYQVWQAFDCMFRKILGAGSPTAHPYAFSTSLLIIIAAALLSATLGLMVTFFGIGMIANALVLVFKSLYLVLMSYVCIGFMTLFAPLVAPMFFFESDWLRDKFKRWIGIIVSCIFQPVMVVGFLAFAVCIDDQFIEGNLPAPGCIVPLFPGMPGYSGSSSGIIPGSGVCSFAQLFNQGATGEPTANLQASFHNLIEDNATMFTQMAAGDPQNAVTQVSATNPTAPYVQTQTANASGNTGTVGVVNGLINNAAQFQWTGATRLKTEAQTPTKQLFLTLLAFFFVNYCLYQLLQVIPQVAASLATYASIALAGRVTLPFENEIRSAFSNGKNKAYDAAAGKGMLPYLKNSLFGSPKSNVNSAGLAGNRNKIGN